MMCPPGQHHHELVESLAVLMDLKESLDHPSQISALRRKTQQTHVEVCAEWFQAFLASTMAPLQHRLVISVRIKA